VLKKCLHATLKALLEKLSFDVGGKAFFRLIEALPYAGERGDSRGKKGRNEKKTGTGERQEEGRMRAENNETDTCQSCGPGHYKGE